MASFLGFLCLIIPTVVWSIQYHTDIQHIWPESIHKAAQAMEL